MWDRDRGCGVLAGRGEIVRRASLGLVAVGDMVELRGFEPLTPISDGTLHDFSLCYTRHVRYQVWTGES